MYFCSYSDFLGFFRCNMKPHYIKEFMGTRTVLMKKDYDEWCFLWALIRLVYPQDRHTHYKKLRDKYLSKFDLRGITAPLTFKSISRLHKQNPWLDATFVFVYTDPAHKKAPYASIGKGQNFYSFLFTKTNITEQTVDLHFYALLNVDAFLTKGYDGAGQKNKKDQTKYFCYNCHHACKTDEQRKEHFLQCVEGNVPQKRTFPPKTRTLKFTNHSAQFKKPVVGYLDFESSLISLESNPCERCEQRACVCAESSTIKTQIHEPLSWCLIFVSHEREVIYEASYSGKGAVPRLFSQLDKAKEIMAAWKQEKRLLVPSLTPQQKKEFDSATHCNICREPFLPDQVRVRDHSHSGKGSYLGVAHRCVIGEFPLPKHGLTFALLTGNAISTARAIAKAMRSISLSTMAQVLKSRNSMTHACSLARSLKLSGYDIHHILKYLDKEADVKGLPKNTQSFRTVTVSK